MILVMDLRHDTLKQRKKNNTRIKIYKIKRVQCVLSKLMFINKLGAMVARDWGSFKRRLSPVYPNPNIC